MITTDFSSLLSKFSQDSIPVLDNTIPISSYFPINLSTSNQAFSAIDYNSPEVVESFMQSIRDTQKCSVLFGGYLEKRNIYKRSTYFNTSEVRDIHLGIDLWAKCGTKVLSVLDGEVHSFNNNTNFGDYGPTVILKHKMGSFTFYSLYGHLSIESIQNKAIGERVKQEEVIGYLGDYTVNGNYASHLHFQLIKDIQNFSGDYPGVCSQKMKSYYKLNCPNPNLLLKIS